MAQRTWQSAFRPRSMALTLVVAGCVLGLTHIPGEDVPQVFQVHDLDKAEHAVAYGLIAGFYRLSLRRPIRPALLLTGLATIVAIAVLDEMTQSWVHRVASFWDFAGDLVGMAIAGALFWGGGLRKRKASFMKRYP